MKIRLFLTLFFLGATLFAELPEPYLSVEMLPFDEQGWFINAEQMKTLLEAKKPRVVVEVGSWIGQSTRFIAEHLSEGSKVFAVDSWTPTESQYQGDKRIPYLYQLFLSNTIHAGLTDKVVPVRMTSLEAAQALSVRADLIYIDGAHDEESVYNDIMAWYPHLTPKGVMCGDDWGCSETVRAGVTRAAESLHLQIVAHKNFWRLI